MPTISEGQKQLNVRIPEALMDQLSQKSKASGRDKGAIVADILTEMLSADHYSAALEAAGNSRDDLAATRMHLDKIFGVVETLIRQKEEARETARHEVRKEMDMRIREIDRLTAKLEEAQQQFKEVKSQLISVHDQMKIIQKDLDSSRKEVLDTQQKADIIERSLADKEELLAEYKARTEKSEAAAKKAASLEQELLEIRRVADNLQGDLQSKNLDLNAAVNDLNRYKKLVQDRNEEVDVLKTAIADMDLERERLQIQADRVPELLNELKMYKDQLAVSYAESASQTKEFAERLEHERSKIRQEEEKRWRELIEEYKTAVFMEKKKRES